MLVALEAMRDTVFANILPEEPTATISPMSYAATAGQSFDFVVTHPDAAGDATVLANARDQRTRIDLWSDQTGAWERVEVWPTWPAGVTWIRSLDASTNTVTLTTTIPGTMLGNEYKFSLATWDREDQPARDTSFQP